MDIAQYFKVGEEGGAFNQVLRALRVCHENGDPHVTCIWFATSARWRIEVENRSGGLNATELGLANCHS